MVTVIVGAMSVKNLASAAKHECHFQVTKLLLYWLHFPETEIWKDSLECLKDLIEICETKLILEQNYIFLSFHGSNTKFIAYFFKKIVTVGEENYSVLSRNIRFLHSQEHILWN